MFGNAKLLICIVHKMILISHRGNISGKQPELENTPVYIRAAAELGYMVEIDVWGTTEGELWLGHDEPQERTSMEFLRSGPYIIHAKNHIAIEPLQYHNLHWFWHNTDDYTLTSRRWIWAYPDKPSAGNNAITVLPEIHNTALDGFVGVCSDVIEQYNT